MRVVTTLFCEKILKLESGNSQLIGVHPGLIRCQPVTPNPMVIMDVQVMLEHHLPETFTIDFRVKGVDGSTLFLHPAKVAFEEPLPWYMLTLNQMAVPLVKSGHVVVELQRQGAWLEAGRLRVELMEAPPMPLSA